MYLLLERTLAIESSLRLTSADLHFKEFLNGSKL
jgi:hypothetical protein